MKKIVTIILLVLMIASPVLTLLGGFFIKPTPLEDVPPDGPNTDQLAFGVGAYLSAAPTDAADDQNGNLAVNITVAGVLLDASQKIVDVIFDTLDTKLEFANGGQAVTPGEFKTKYELKEAYGMSAPWSGKTEWYLQVDGLCSAIRGKTLEEVKGMVVNGYQGNEEIVAAGCTIAISDFVAALEKAVANAAPSGAKAGDALSLGLVGKDTAADASGDGDGKHSLEVNYTVMASNGGKVTAATSDCVTTECAFNTAGKVTKHSIASKRELKENYGMSAIGKTEWYLQVDALDALYLGKTKDEVAALFVNYTPDPSVTGAGCTVYAGNLIAAAVKALENAPGLAFGVGAYLSAAPTDAADDQNGNLAVNITVAGVLLDASQKIVDVIFDTLDTKLEFANGGQAVTPGEFKTKYELKEAYGMSAPWSGKTEWYLQVDGLCSAIRGKTLEEVKGMVVNGYQGNEEIVAAGCTIAISDFVAALEKAVANAAPSGAKAGDALSLGLVGKDTAADASGDGDGKHSLEVNYTVMASNGGKVTAATSDCVTAECAFNTAGQVTKHSIASKRELKENYGMSAIGKTEWYLQVDALDALYLGKTKDEVAALFVNYTPDPSVTGAGCTVYAGNLIAAAVKAFQ